MSNVLLEEIILGLEKIQAIGNLLTSQTEEDLSAIGAVICDITFPLIEKIKKNETP